MQSFFKVLRANSRGQNSASVLMRGFFSCLGEQAAVRIGSGFYGISLLCNKKEIIQFLNISYHCSNGKNNTLSPLFIFSISSYALIL